MKHYERRLPHLDVIGQPLFVTFRLHGSLPGSRIFPPDELSTSGKAFVAMDRLLDRGESGPLHLKREEIASLVVTALLEGHIKHNRYGLHAFVVMPNHVHILATPVVIARRWLGPLKGATSYEANKLLGVVRVPFWQDESYDHVVRSGDEFEKIRRYIEENPVKAGLVSDARKFRWSSASEAD
jgi:putative transposase